MNLFDFPLFPESASTFSGQVDALYFFSLAVSAFFSLLIAAAAIFLMVRYKRKHKDEVGAPIHGSLTLEIAWSFIPLVVTMVLFAWGAKVYFDTTTPPTDAREYFVTGKQWMWKAQHPEGQREINHLHVPVDTPIKLTMTSEDTIHSFYIPAFRIKRDVLPGRYTTVWFEATKTGTYHLFCAEYCGAEHSKMIGSVIVMEQDEYQNWLSGGLEAISPIASGEKLFEQYACNTCHYEEATGRGPSLHGIVGESANLIGGNSVERDDNYLRESILNPRAKVVMGYQPIMPTFQGQISEEKLGHILAYIKSLELEEATEDAAALDAAVTADLSAAANATEPASITQGG